jgi:hypothetical protein
LNNALLNNKWATEGIKRRNLNFLESNENENIIYYKLWDIVKPILRRESA